MEAWASESARVPASIQVVLCSLFFMGLATIRRPRASSRLRRRKTLQSFSGKIKFRRRLTKFTHTGRQAGPAGDQRIQPLAPDGRCLTQRSPAVANLAHAIPAQQTVFRRESNARMSLSCRMTRGIVNFSRIRRSRALFFGPPPRHSIGQGGRPDRSSADSAKREASRRSRRLDQAGQFGLNRKRPMQCHRWFQSFRPVHRVTNQSRHSAPLSQLASISASAVTG